MSNLEQTELSTAKEINGTVEEIPELSVKEVRACGKVYSQLMAENPLLTKEEEFDLAKTIRENPSEKNKQDARDKFLNCNVGLVLKIANKYRTRTSLDINDLISAGVQGLVIAVDKFNPEAFQNKFSTYAHHWIVVYIERLVRSFRYNVYIPSNILEKYYQMRRIEAEEPDLNDKDLRKALGGISAKALDKIRTVPFSIGGFSLNEPIGEDGACYEDIVGDFSGVLPDARCEMKDISEKKQAMFAKSLSELTAIQRFVIEERFLSEGNTLEGIASKKGLSKERIRQIEEKALIRLKIKIREKMSVGGGIQ